ncbi:MAG: hypothetical protein H0Z35_09235 [Thermoanaerobacteraceae bacterium]|nr:hypothetical protein [Thermoanaerobacteraceae bacterium]
MKAGGRAALLHHLFQRLGITPDEFYAKPFKVRAFMLASMMVQLEAEEEERKERERKARDGGGK